VAHHRAALAEALRDGPAARVADARDRQWDILCDAGRLPVAVDAERLRYANLKFNPANRTLRSRI
jgi:hypothetical protein